MSVAYFQSNRNLDFQFGNQSYSVPTTHYFGLSTTPVNDDGTGATEPVGNGYAREGATNDKTTWSNASNGSLTNQVEIAFNESTGAWGTITHVLVYDALTSGNVLYFATLTSSRVVQNATTVKFDVGSITVSQVNS